MSPNNRLGTLSIEKLGRQLSARDNAILCSLDEHRFLSTTQIGKLHFWDHATEHAGIRACVRVLGRLHELQLITRLQRPVGGFRGGSSAFIWTLAAAGDRYVRAHYGSHKRRRVFEPTLLFLVHTLAIADLRIELEQLARSDELELLTVETEPSTWRPFLTRSGASQILKPDLSAVTARGDFESHYFIELDRGTESLPVLLAKCRIYQAYYHAGDEQNRHGLFPQVLWLIPDGGRRKRLQKAIAEDRQLEARLFRIIAPEAFTELLLESDESATNEDKGSG